MKGKYASFQMERKRPKQSSKGSFAFGPEKYRTFREKCPR